MAKIEVHHEWGALREAVCGIPFFKIPEALPKAMYSYAPTEGIAFFEANLGKTLEEADPAMYAKAADADVITNASAGTRHPHRPYKRNEGHGDEPRRRPSLSRCNHRRCVGEEVLEADVPVPNAA